MNSVWLALRSGELKNVAGRPSVVFVMTWVPAVGPEEAMAVAGIGFPPGTTLAFRSITFRGGVVSSPGGGGGGGAEPFKFMMPA